MNGLVTGTVVRLPNWVRLCPLLVKTSESTYMKLTVQCQRRIYVVVDFSKKRFAVERILYDRLRTDRHPNIARENGVFAGGRTLIILGAGLSKQAAVVIEAEIQSVGNWCRSAVSGE